MRISIDGIDMALERIRSAPDKIQTKGLKAGLKAASLEAVKDLRAVVPVQTGLLQKSIGTKILKPRGDEISAVKIGSTRAGSDNRYYILRFLEDGTKPHMLRAWDKNGKRYGTYSIRKMNESGQRVARSIMHPGEHASLLMEKLAQANESRYGDIFLQAVDDYIEEIGGV